MMTRLYAILGVVALSCTELLAAGQPGPGGGGATPGPGAGQEGADPAAGGFSGFPFYMLILMLVLMYFVLIRPQGKEQKRRKAMMEDIKVGDAIVTIGGIHGKVARRGENDIDIEIKDGSVMTLNLGAINQVITDGEPIDGRA